MADEFLEKFYETFTCAAHEAGIGKLEFYTETLQKAGVQVYRGEIESQSLSEVSSCYVEGEYRGFRGYVYVEDFSEEYYPEHIDNMRQIAEALKEPQKARALCPENGFTVTKPEIEFHADGTELAEKLFQAEREALAYDPRVSKIQRLSGSETVRRIVLRNDRGDRLEDAVGYTQFGMEVIAQEGAAVQTGGQSRIFGEVAQIDARQIAREAAAEAVGILNACPVKTGRYPVIIKNNVICEMLATYLPVFCGDSVRKKLTRLKDSLGQQAAAPMIHLYEDPFLPDGVNRRWFDDEGVAAARKDIIKDGVLKTFLYNKEEAGKAGTVSTGNGFKQSYKSVPGIRITNLKLEGQTGHTMETLMEQMQNGLFITACDGMFAGADVVSGNFSLISKGHMVENGRVGKGVNQITIAGNFFDLLKEIEALGCDELMTGDVQGVVIAPSVRVGSMVVSGI